MSNKKSQLAMDFLMTYGWAILLLLVCIGALFYFGVLDSCDYLPGECNDTVIIDVISVEDLLVDYVNDTVYREGCEWVVFVDDYFVVDCYEDVFWRRMEHLSRSGSYCFFDDTIDGINFVIKCKWGNGGVSL